MAGTFKSREDLIKFYSDELIKLIDSVSKIIYVVFFFILFCWIYIIEGLNIRYKIFYADHNKQIETLTIQLKNQKKKLYTINYIFNPDNSKLNRDSILNSPKKSQLDVPYANSVINDNLISKHSVSDSLRKRIDQLKSEINNSASFLEQKDFNDIIKDVPFPFKTIFYFTNSLKNGPQSIIIIITFLIIYVYYSRIKVLRYSARIIRLIKSDESYPNNPDRDIFITNPFWSSPIPVASIHITNDEYIEFTGNKGNKYTYVIFLYAIFIILIAIEIRMLWLQISYNILSPLNGLFFGTLLMVIVSICFVIDWISKWKIPDNLNNENKDINYNKRRFLLASGSAVLILGVYFFSNKISKIIKPSSYKKKAVVRLPLPSTQKSLYNHFVRNIKTKNYLFFDNKGNNPNVGFATARGWERFGKNVRITTNTFALKKANKKTHVSSWMLEHLTLSLIADKKYEDAFSLLSNNITKHVQNIRLWDLFAKTYTISLKASKKYEQTFNRICDEKKYYNLILINRIKKFHTEEWRSKLLSNNNNIFNGQKL